MPGHRSALTLAGAARSGNDNGVGAAASFNHPEGVAVDAEGNVYVADTNNNEIRKITPAGMVTILAGSGAPSEFKWICDYALLNRAAGVGVDAAGNIYVADSGDGVIRMITPGAGGKVYALSKVDSHSDLLRGLAIGLSGNEDTVSVYAAESGDNIIDKLTLTIAR